MNLFHSKRQQKIGTDKVIRDHANIGVVVTTDGTVNGIKRSAAEVAERQVIEELQEIGKPFVIVLNSTMPAHENTIRLRNELLEIQCAGACCCNRAAIEKGHHLYFAGGTI